MMDSFDYQCKLLRNDFKLCQLSGRWFITNPRVMTQNCLDFVFIRIDFVSLDFKEEDLKTWEPIP